MKLLRFLKFALVGGIGAMCYFMGSLTLTFFGVEAWVASLIIYICLVPIIYLLQKKIVFNSDQTHSKSFPRYLIIQFIGIILSAFVPFVFSLFKIDPMASFFFVVMFVTMINYSLQRSWVFKK